MTAAAGNQLVVQPNYSKLTKMTMIYIIIIILLCMIVGLTSEELFRCADCQKQLINAECNYI